ncbi:MAG TPA: hypothetical protein VHZ24_06220 [Pirellulales bacterium]|jgi:hypothetical protein|nr:hypothetical protein [Pirellulales bacterium]
MNRPTMPWIMSRLPFAIGFAAAAGVAKGPHKSDLWVPAILVGTLAAWPLVGAMIGAGVGNFFGADRPVKRGWLIGSWVAALSIIALLVFAYSSARTQG